MKFSPLEWNEVKTNVETSCPKGWLRLRVSAPCALYLQAQGYEALVCVASSFDVQIAEKMIFRLDAPKGVRAFLKMPDQTSFSSEGEVFTNIDRMADESGTVLEVTRALRSLEIERRSVLREIRAERASLASERAALPPPVLEPVLDPVIEAIAE